MQEIIDKGYGSEFTPWSFPWIKIRTKRHLYDMFKLATPIIISRLAMMMMALVDYALVLRYSPEQAKWLTLALGATDGIFGACIGLTIGVPVLISRYYGAGSFNAIGKVWRQGIIWSNITGALLMVAVIMVSPYLMSIFGNKEIADDAFPLVVVYAASFVPAMIAMTGNSLLESTENAKPVLLAAVLSNVLNLFCNLVLIYGLLGFPELGALGAAYATLIIRIFMGIFISLYIMLYKHAKKYNIRSFSLNSILRWREFCVIGLTAAISIAAEGGGFSILTMMTSRLSDVQAGSLGITMRVMGTMFMIGLGLSTATSVRVGIARGRRDFADQIFALIVGSVLTIALLLILGSICIAFNTEIAQIFSKDAAIIALAASLISIAFLAFIPDSLQVVFGQSLRTAGIVTWPTITDITHFAFLMPSLGYILAFTFGYEEYGFLYAIIISLWLASLVKFLGFVFFHKSIRALTAAGVSEE